MKVLETGEKARVALRTLNQRRGLVTGNLAFASNDDFFDKNHPFNNYSPEAKESDRDAHEKGESGAPDWFYQQFVDKYGHEPEGYHKDDKDR